MPSRRIRHHQPSVAHPCPQNTNLATKQQLRLPTAATSRNEKKSRALPLPHFDRGKESACLARRVYRCAFTMVPVGPGKVPATYARIRVWTVYESVVLCSGLGVTCHQPQFFKSSRAGTSSLQNYYHPCLVYTIHYNL